MQPEIDNPTIDELLQPIETEGAKEIAEKIKQRFDALTKEVQELKKFIDIKYKLDIVLDNLMNNAETVLKEHSIHKQFNAPINQLEENGVIDQDLIRELSLDLNRAIYFSIILRQTKLAENALDTDDIKTAKAQFQEDDFKLALRQLEGSKKPTMQRYLDIKAKLDKY